MKLPVSLTFLALLGASVVPLSASGISCDAVAGNLVANCGFESGDLTSWTTGGNFEFTQIVSGAFYVYTDANAGTYYLTAGPVGSDGSISQTLSTSTEEYTFSFYFAAVGDDPSDFSALWDGTPLLSLTDPSTSGVFTQYSYTVTGTGSDTIQFNFRDDPAYIALDDVVVTAGTSAVPEPGTLGMLAGGLGLIFVGLRRRSRRG